MKKKNVQMIIAAILAVAIAVTGAVILTLGQMKASEDAEDGYTVVEETSTTIEEIEIETPAAETEETVEETEASAETEAAEAVEETEEAETEEAETVERKVVVTTSIDGAETVDLGTEITLYASLYGYDGVNYTLTWQRSLDGANWESIDAHDAAYTFVIDADNCAYYWRADVVAAN